MIAAGVEPAAYGFGNHHSVRLSYAIEMEGLGRIELAFLNVRSVPLLSGELQALSL